MFLSYLILFMPYSIQMTRLNSRSQLCVCLKDSTDPHKAMQ